MTTFVPKYVLIEVSMIRLCYGVTVEPGYRENSGSDVPVQRWERE